MSIDSIRVISQEEGMPFVPPIEQFEVLSETWRECEYRCFETEDKRSLGGVWEGEPGALKLTPWPYDEVCVLLSGRVALQDENGGRREFAAGEAFFVPRTFQGTWETIEPSRKIFVAIDVETSAS